MEFLLLGAVVCIMVVGSFAGFFSIFTKGDQLSRLQSLENEIRQLKQQMQALTSASPPLSAPLATKSSEVHIEPVAEDATPSEALASTEKAEESTQIAVEETALEAISDISENLALHQPNMVERAVEYVKDWFLSGNTLVRAGVIILFIGVAFLVKLAADNNVLPIELRLTGVVLLGLGLLVFGWKKRVEKPQFSWALQGGGVGVMYLTIFAAYRLYHLIPSSFAFALLLVIALLSAALAVLQSALPLAILGFSGGFLAPIFTSDGSGNHVGLFSYYLMLNLAIAAIAYFRSWRALNVLGFAFTFIIGTLWGAKNYTPAYFSSTEPFLVIHFLLYTAIAVIFAFRQAPKAKDYVDATLVFGTPLVGFSLQYALLSDSHFGLAYSALVLGLFYLSLTWWLFKRQHPNLRFLGECFLALGVGFATLAIPLALDGRWTSAAWAVEGVGLLWVGLRQQRLLPTWSGMALQVLAALAFTKGWGLTGYSDTTHQNLYLGVAFIALSGWACGALWHRFKPQQTSLATLCAIWGWLWWAGAIITAVDALLPNRYFGHASLGLLALTSVLIPYAAKYLRWPNLTMLCRLLLPIMIIGTGTQWIISSYYSPLNDVGMVAWPFALAVYAALMAGDHVPKQAHWRAPWLWVLTLIGIWSLFDVAYHDIGLTGTWLEISYFIVPIGVLLAVLHWLNKGGRMPAITRTWGWVASLPIAAGLVFWFFGMTLYADGNAAPLPYVPLLNPLDISLSATLAILLLWRRQVSDHLQAQGLQITQYLAGMMGFTLLNGVLLRTLHHWVGTPLEWTAIFNYPTVQVAFTFLWSLSAFVLMWLAHKRGMRPLWMVGAALMALVVAKLFLLDLAQHGSVQRIASFMSAGLLLLVMGYVAPLPPASSEREEVNHEAN